MEEVTIVEVNGTEYYCPTEAVDYLTVVDGALINTSNSTVYLYHNFREYGDNSKGYPRITCQPYYKAYYTASYNSNSYTLNVNSYEIKNRSFNDLFLIGVVIVGLLSIMLFKKR